MNTLMSSCLIEGSSADTEDAIGTPPAEAAAAGLSETSLRFARLTPNFFFLVGGASVESGDSMTM